MLALLAEHNVALALSEGRWIPRKQMMQLADAADRGLHLRPLMGIDQSIVDYSRVQLDRTRDLEAWARCLWPYAEQGREVFVLREQPFRRAFAGVGARAAAPAPARAPSSRSSSASR